MKKENFSDEFGSHCPPGGYKLTNLKECFLGACGDFMVSLLAMLFDAPEQICGDDGVFAPLTVFKDRLAVLRFFAVSGRNAGKRL